MADVRNAQRILRLQQLLFHETDEQHELSMKEILERLQREFGESFKVDQRAVKRDMDVLSEEGFEIVVNTGSRGKALYSHQDRVFETYQLRLLVDAVLSARFITEKEKEKLIRQLKKLTSDPVARSLPDPIIYHQSSNVDYNMIKLNIDVIHSALSEQKVLTFQYGKYQLDKKFHLRRDGTRYEVHPYALIWQKDYYYLIAEHLETGEFRHYRLDRMRKAEMEPRRFTKKALDISTYMHQSFHMFSGNEERIKVRFDGDLLNVVLDRFGMEAEIEERAHGRFVLTAKAKVSEGLEKWLLSLGPKVKVMEPESLVTRIIAHVTKMNNLYS